MLLNLNSQEFIPSGISLRFEVKTFTASFTEFDASVRNSKVIKLL